MPYNVVYSFVFNKEIMDCKHNFNTFLRVDEIVTSVQVRSAPRRGWWRAGRCGVMPPLPVAAPRGATHSTAKRGTPSTSAATLLLCCHQCFTPLLTRHNEVDLSVKWGKITKF